MAYLLKIQDFPGFSRVRPPFFSPARFARRDFRLRPSACPSFSRNFRLRPSACPRSPGIFASDLVLVPDFPDLDPRKLKYHYTPFPIFFV